MIENVASEHSAGVIDQQEPAFEGSSQENEVQVDGLRGAFRSVKSHDLVSHVEFGRGADLLCNVPISFTTAALGGHVEVPTLGGGRARITIPEGTQSGKQFRLRGKGMPGLRGQGAHGELFVEVAVEVPVNLTKKQQELLRDFDKAGNAQNSPQTSSFFAKVKEFFSESKE